MEKAIEEVQRMIENMESGIAYDLQQIDRVLGWITDNQEALAKYQKYYNEHVESLASLRRALVKLQES